MEADIFMGVVFYQRLRYPPTANTAAPFRGWLYCNILVYLIINLQWRLCLFVFYYRHMVSDKFQARSTGAVVNVTRQPVKGRKKGGGIRLGEMERDALIAHGVAFCVHDRYIVVNNLYCSTLMKQLKLPEYSVVDL